MRFTGILPGAVERPRAVHIYRVTMPFAYIGKHTKHEVGWISSTDFAVKLTREQLNSVLDSDIIVMARPVSNDPDTVMEQMHWLRTHNAKIVYEADDDLTELYRDTTGGTGASCRPYLPLCDAVTCTTPHLAERLSIYTDAPIYTLYNYVELPFFSKVACAHKRQYPDTLNVMLVGTPTHGVDWTYAAQAMEPILDEFANVRLLVAGFQPDYINESYASTGRIVSMPFVPYSAYPTTLAEADIVIAAIDPDDGFNQCKSAVKALEAWATVRPVGHTTGGAAVVATESVVYSPVVKHERNGLLVEHSVSGYYEAVRRLIVDAHLRQALQRRGFLDVAKDYNIARNWQRWLQAYSKIARL